MKTTERSTQPYCWDISIKTRSSLAVKRRNDDFVGAFPVYGYMKAEDNKDLLVPGPYTSRVVCDIFCMRLNAAEVEQAVFLALKKQVEAVTPLALDGTLRVDASVPERAEYEQQTEALQDGKRTLYERYLVGEIDLNTYMAEKAACDELLLKTKNVYAAVLAQAKQKRDEQARQDGAKKRPGRFSTRTR